MKKTIIASAFMFSALLALCLTQGRLYAMHVYGEPCGQATGFTGFLQKTHFLPSADCKLPCGSGSCNLTNPVSGKSTPGKCAPTTKPAGCVCVAK
jgi:hypothetical protein